METFLWGLALAGVSALAWVAYNHPNQYHFLAIVLVPLGFGAMIYVIAFNSGASAASLAIKIDPKTMDYETWVQARDAALSVLFEDKHFFGALFSTLYVCVLGLLPMIGLVNPNPR